MLRTDSRPAPRHKVIRRSAAPIVTINHRGNSDKSCSAPETARSARITAVGGRGSSKSCLLLLVLPLEIRLQIYEHLLHCWERIAVSPRRRQQSNEGERCLYCGRSHLKVAPPWRPHVAILRTCKQCNAEATPILYRKNEFVIGFLINKPFQAKHFFPWFLRQSTLSQMRTVTFRVGCHCTNWVVADQQQWETDGCALARTIFPRCVFGRLLPSPVRAREAHAMIRSRLLSDTRTYSNPCMACRL